MTGLYNTQRCQVTASSQLDTTSEPYRAKEAKLLVRRRDAGRGLAPASVKES